MDKLAEWLKRTDSLGGSLDRRTDELSRSWREAQEQLELAISEATASQVAEDDIAFAEAIEPVKTAVARVKASLQAWEDFLGEIEPRL